MKKIIYLIVWFIVGVLSGAHGQQLDSTYFKTKIVRVFDADSYEILINGEKKSIRIYGVDAPEKRSLYICEEQPFAVKATEIVRGELLQKEVYVKIMGIDKYNRQVARVNFDSTDYAYRLVTRGLAWVYRTKDMSDAEYEILQSAKRLAEVRKDGLFGEKGRKYHPMTWKSRHKCGVKKKWFFGLF